MKPGIHPNYKESQIVCACGNSFATRSTKQNLRVDLCNVCHPFYTGEQRIVDTQGQVERFMKRMESAAALDPKVSKRQQRIADREAQLAEERRHAAELAAAEAAAARDARKAAKAAAAEVAAAAAAAAPPVVEAEAVAESVEAEAPEAVVAEAEVAE